LGRVAQERVECGVIGHAWDDVSGSGGGVDKGGKKVLQGAKRKVFRCTRCGTVREEAWSKVTGQLMSRAYEYPDDYKLPKVLVEGETQRETLRKVWIRRG